MPAPKGTGKRKSPPPTTPKSTRGNPSRGKSWEERRQEEVRKHKSEDIEIESDNSSDSDSDSDNDSETEETISKSMMQKKRELKKSNNFKEHDAKNHFNNLFRNRNSTFMKITGNRFI